MGGILLKLKNWWQTADKTQKTITVVGGGFLVLLLFGTFVFASKPKMSLVFTNLSPADAGSVSMEIENMGIPVTFDGGGNVQVPSDKVAKVRAALAMSGKLPRGGEHFTSDALDKMNMFSTDEVQTAKLMAIKEAELTQSIQFFDSVDSANVKISPAIDSPFESEKRAAQANVTVGERAGEMVTPEQARAMANLVASAVRGLDKSKVTIFSRTGRALWDGSDLQDGSASATNKLDLEKRESRKKRDELQDALNRMLGPGNAIAMVNVTLDTSEVQEHRIESEPTKKPSAMTKMSETVASQNSNGESARAAGMDSNTPDTDAASSGSSTTGKSDYSIEKVQVQNEFNKKITDTRRGVGEIKSMAVTVLVNKTEKMTPADQQSIQELANSFIGPKLATDTENFSAKVVAYPFDQTQAKAAKDAEAAAASSSRMQQILSVLPIAALMVVAFLVVRALGKMSPRFPGGSPMLAMAGGPALPMTPDALALESRSSSRSLEAANRFVLPEVVKQRAMEAGITEEQLTAALEEAGEKGLTLDDIPSIKNKVNVPLEQIKKMAGERPEAVAMLIKSWLIEEGLRR